MERFMIRVGIAEAHTVVREGIRSALEAAGDIEVAGEASDGDGTLHLVRTESPAVLTLGLAMQGVSGTDLIRKIRRAGPLPRIVVVTRRSETTVASLCFAAGASGFVVKTSPAHELLAAIRKVASGGVYVNLAPSDEPMLDEVAAESSLPHERLTSTELHIFLRIACGQTAADIAATLGTSPKTISSHRTNIIRKMRLRSDVDLIRYAIVYKLVPDDDPSA
ncbi:DNA-binding NarL/FixJ family response regulator [Paraburkholderia tropica]|uniref:response regulator n=1 Tax=Paraburkholderia tropica TaxID=92647 RepID=UPI00160712FD|nr:response regulator transcription factor [Paraburkholderia tropica]MBB3005308.1 DNA-binding NarL/FixJ family response regulator [Paraburkholderia tropica]MBB6324217.1 DNA-binding NarL/FixJ family response regulator [Paraburkholderia tropica]